MEKDHTEYAKIACNEAKMCVNYH